MSREMETCLHFRGTALNACVSFPFVSFFCKKNGTFFMQEWISKIVEMIKICQDFIWMVTIVSERNGHMIEVCEM